MNYKLKYLLKGMLIGMVISIISLIFEFIGNHPDIIDIVEIVIMCIVIGAVIGLFVGFCTDRRERQEALVRAEQEQQEAMARAEQERQEALARAEQERQATLNKAKKLLDNIYKSYYEGNGIFKTEKYRNGNYYTVWTFKGEYESIYNGMWQIKSKIISFGNSYLMQFNKLIQEHIELLNNEIKSELEDLVNIQCSSPEYTLKRILHKMMLLKYADERKVKYDSSIYAIKEFIELLEKPMYFLKSNEYGNFTLFLDNPEEMIDMNENAFAVEDKLVYMLAVILDNSNDFDDYYSNIGNCLTEEFLKSAGKLMWYYAKKQPFEVDKFNTACSIYERFTIGDRKFVSGYDIDADDRYYSKPETVKLEELLAIIYNKLTIGGSTLAQQEKKKIDEWIKDYHHKEKDVEILASALAWMELYDLELNVLRAMVERKIQMSPEVQERLRFLESGGTSSNVKIYEVVPEKDFLYNSSSEHWNTNEFDVFFRKVGMKKLTLNYSLSISAWKKTLPLSGGQKASMNDLYKEFESMVADFDGEVTCVRTTAKAIDLDNVSYSDAVVFQFTSERNKCLSMLFSCEKFGRNLNLTIITLFTPDNSMSVENMQKYATAIKSNIYVDSFRETILQSVDEVIKEKQDIYVDENDSSSGKKFVE